MEPNESGEETERRRQVRRMLQMLDITNAAYVNLVDVDSTSQGLRQADPKQPPYEP